MTRGEKVQSITKFSFLLVLSAVCFLSIVSCDRETNKPRLERPSSVFHYQYTSPIQPDNILDHSFSISKNSAEEPIGFGFNTHFYNQYSSQFTPFDVSWIERIGDMYVLEFTFPKNIYDRTINIDWEAQLRIDGFVTCKTDHRSNGLQHASTGSRIYFDYVVFEDPNGVFGNDSIAQRLALLPVLKAHMENTEENRVDFGEPCSGCTGGFSDYALLDYRDKRQGRMTVQDGKQAKLFLGVAIMIFATDADQRIRLFGRHNLVNTEASFHVRGPSDDEIWHGPEYVFSFPD